MLYLLHASSLKLTHTLIMCEAVSFDVSEQECFCFINAGNQHRLKVQLCMCEAEAITFLRFNLWPATPVRPSLVFEVELLEWLEALLLECCISVQGFCYSIDVKIGRRISREVRMKS